MQLAKYPESADRLPADPLGCHALPPGGFSQREGELPLSILAGVVTLEVPGRAKYTFATLEPKIIHIGIDGALATEPPRTQPPRNSKRSEPHATNLLTGTDVGQSKERYQQP